jgi:hypothetical protein
MSAARTRLLEALTTAGCKIANGGTASTCPAHEDHAPSLSIGARRDRDGVLIRCHAGCDTADVLAALGMTEADLFDAPKATTSRPQVVATYPYVDEAGTVLFEKVRMQPKDFRQRRREAGGWVWNLTGVRRVLYRLPEVLAAINAGSPVFVCEGEKDADALARAGLTATTWTEGAWKPGQTAKWRSEYTDTLKGADVAIVRDRDEAGRHTASTIAGLLTGTARSVAVIEPAEGKDVSDHLEAGKGPLDLVAADLTAEAAAEVAPLASDGSDASEGSDGSEGPPLHRGIKLSEDHREDGAALLDEVRDWLGRHITVIDPTDLDVLTLWAAHTHLSTALYTTPRLQIDSPVPESGKTTVLEHLERLCFKASQASSISSSALLARIVSVEPRTLLLDEVDRTLDPKKEGVGDLYAILNGGYKVGAKRPTLMPTKGGKWEVDELSTFAPVALAGNQPNLPDDTRSRIIRVLLYPDWTGRAEESDWENDEVHVSTLGARLARWARHVREDVRARPQMPPGCTGRFREKWQPLARVAQAAGPGWVAVVMDRAARDVADVAADRDAGLAAEKPGVLLLRHITQLWPAGETFWGTRDLVNTLILEHPEAWGAESPYGKALTVQRMGRMLATNYGIRSTQEDTADKNSTRGYRRDMFVGAAHALTSRSDGLPEGSPDPLPEPPERPELSEPSERCCPACGGALKPGRELCGPCGHAALMCERIAKAEAAS